MDFRYTSIVIALDDAGSAGRALDYGLDMAESLRLPVRLVHVVALRNSQSHTAGIRQVDLDDIIEAANGVPEYELAAELLNRALVRAGDRNVEIEPVLLGGEPADALLRYLADCDRPMLVMGRRGQGRIRELLLGSISDQVIRHASCPVTVVT